MKTHDLAVLGIAALSLAACVEPSTTTIAGPSGQAVSTAKCSGSSETCMQAAADACKGPYQVVDSYSKAGGIVADVLPGPVTWYYLTYQCGKSDGRMPAFPFRGQSYQPPPVVAAPPRQATTTTCSAFGNTMTCDSY